MKKLYLLLVFVLIAPVLFAQVTKIVQLNNPGTLVSNLTTDELNITTDLTITGFIDARDFKTMRDLMPVLANLDLSGVTIGAYSGTEGTVIGNINYPANSVPKSALNNKTSLKSVVFANSITSISYESFLSCSSLESVILPSNLLFIDGRAFGYCNLTSISLPSTLQSIGNYAFATNNIPNVEIPASVQSIGSGVFYQNRLLKEINVNPSNPNYCSIDGVLFNKDHSELMHYPNGKTNTSYSLPDGVQKIQARSFDGGNSNLRNVTIPEGVIEIGFWAFANVWNLESIDIPSSIVVISNGAFIGQRNYLQSIKIRKNIPVTISSDAFGDVNKSTCVLYVPFGTKTDYQNANVWKDFQNIVEMEEVKKTYVPDNNFEQALIDLGYDSGVLDDYVPTANISILTSLNVSNKGISDLTGIQDFISLIQLNCGINNLTTIDIIKNINLQILLVYSNQLTSLDVTNNTNLQQIYGNNNLVNDLDLSKNPFLNTLDFGNNKLTNLDLSQNPYMAILNCTYNQISNIDLSANVNLEQIGIGGNPISVIDITKNLKLRWFYVYSTNLTTIDCSNHPGLESIDCSRNNLLTTLNLKNGNNTILKNVFAIENPGLQCIQVDEPVSAAAKTNWKKDNQASYSLDCTPPVVNAGDDQTVNENTVVTLDGSASYDPNGTDLDYSWAAPEGVTISGINTANPSFIAPEVNTDTELTFTLTVTDIGGNTSSDEVKVTVLQVNKLPTANAGADQTVNIETLVTLDGSLSFDPDNDELTYNWSAPSGIALDLTDPQKPVFTAPLVNQNTSYTFSLVVNDGQMDSETDEVTIYVINPFSPIANCNDITINLNANGSYSLTSTDLNNLAAGTDDDNDSFKKLRIAAVPNSYGCADIGNPVLVNVTVTDLTNYSATCNSTVTVKDVTAPVFTSRPKSIYKSISAGQNYVLPAFYETYKATDACSNNIVYTQIPEPGKVYSASAREMVIITATDASGNKSQISFSLNVNLVNRLKSADTDLFNEAEANVNFEVYPNPTNGIVNIITSNKNVTIEVLTSSGVSVLKDYFDEAQVRLNLNKYAEGIYFIKVSSNDEQGVFKIVLKK
jgi:hypothetical protein